MKSEGLRRRRKARTRMDPFVAVALSMLPASRSRVACTFKEIRLQSGPGSDGWRVTCSRPCSRRARSPRTNVPAPCSWRASRADAALAAARAAGIEPLPWHDPRFPALLSCIPDPPPLLWVRGDVAALARPTVAIVGSRAATPYALDVAHRLGQELSDRGMVVASGLARGVDSAAHRGCLGGWRADRRRARLGARPHLSVRARGAGPRDI